MLEIVEHERTALIVQPRAPVDLAGAIALLLASPSLRRTMGVAASARAHLDRQMMISALHAWCAEIHAAWAEELVTVPRSALPHLAFQKGGVGSS